MKTLAVIGAGMFALSFTGLPSAAAVALWGLIFKLLEAMP